SVAFGPRLPRPSYTWALISAILSPKRPWPTLLPWDCSGAGSRSLRSTRTGHHTDARPVWRVDLCPAWVQKGGMERIPILKMGKFLLVTIQVDMDDRLALTLHDD